MATDPRAVSANCLVCGVPLTGLASVFLSLRGIRRCTRNPHCCTRCNTHLEEGLIVELTVLFADLTSFTAMTNRLGAETTYAVVDEFLRHASATLKDHGAMIDKYIGDAVMAFFNIPVKRADHAAAAVAAAAQLQRELPELSRKLGHELRASIGIATGYARVGRLGSDDAKDYTAIGEVVNEAARLQAHARPGEILVSERVYAAVAERYPGVGAESLELKGFSEPATARRLNGPPSAPHDDSAWRSGRPVMNWSAIALAFLGSGCLGTSFTAGVMGVFGLGSLGSLLTVYRLLDDSPWRLPVMLTAATLSAGVLVSLERQRRFRRDCLARHSCLKMTSSEKRGAWLAATLAATALLLALAEPVMHSFGHGHP